MLLDSTILILAATGRHDRLDSHETLSLVRMRRVPRVRDGRRRRRFVFPAPPGRPGGAPFLRPAPFPHKEWTLRRYGERRRKTLSLQTWNVAQIAGSLGINDPTAPLIPGCARPRVYGRSTDGQPCLDTPFPARCVPFCPNWLTGKLGKVAYTAQAGAAPRFTGRLRPSALRAAWSGRARQGH